MTLCAARRSDRASIQTIHKKHRIVPNHSRMISIHVPECTWKWPTLSNEAVLLISISLFLLFSLSQLIGALVSDSLALLGDSICMLVDVASYMCNTYVEWYKTRHGRVTFGSRVFTELIVPSLSVLSLLAVTIYITYDAIVVLDDPPVNDTVNVDYLYAFASINLLVDIGCNLLFYMKGEDAFQEEKVTIPQLSLNTSLAQDADDEFGKLDEDEFDWRITAPNTSKSAQSAQDSRSICSCAACCYMCRFPTTAHVHAGKKSNLNMLSAFTHIIGDTFRTLSTFLAAIISSLSGVDGDICDAWAAIVVTITIILLSVMLLNEIKDAALEIWHEDCSETMSSHAASYPDGNSNKKAKVMSSSNHIYQRVAENDSSDNDSMIVI